MPTLLIVGIVFALLVLFSLVLQTGSLWLMCRLVRLKEVTFRRALLAVIVTGIVGALASYAFDFLFAKMVDDEPLLILLGHAASFLISVVVSLLTIPLVLRVAFFRGLLAALGDLVLRAILVVVMVLGIRATMAEAFVIPTGGMAPTILGYHKDVPCPHCGFVFEVNASLEADGPPEHRRRVSNCTCPNCRTGVDIAALAPVPQVQGGDRALTVHRGFDRLLRMKSTPQRLDPVIFQYPGDTGNTPPLLYVKRLIGMPGETIAIHEGDLFVSDEVPGQEGATTTDDSDARRLFNEGKFRIIRKPPDLLLDMRRIVYDHDHPHRAAPAPRWEWAGGWTADGRRFSHAADQAESWLTYRHRVGNEGQPQLVTSFDAYNSGREFDLPRENWVGDLLLECELTVDKNEGQFLLELGRGVDRFQARWDLAGGDCTILRKTGDAEETLSTKPTAVARPGTYRLRLANVDRRVTVWVDDALPFGEGIAYEAPETRGPTERDLEPARVGARQAAVHVSHLRLWRDIYYTGGRFGDPTGSDAETGDWSSLSPVWGEPDEWGPWRALPVRTYFVQSGHYFVMGDNSAQSSDSRHWGGVPDRLMRGRAILLYYPFTRFRAIH